MLKRDPILISLSPSALRVGVCGASQVVRVERTILADRPNAKPEEAWDQGLRSLDDELHQAVAALNIRPGSEAFVLYHGPHCVAEVFSVPGVGSQAVAAIGLYLQQNLPNAGLQWMKQHHLIEGAAPSDALGAFTMQPTGQTPAAGVARSTALTYADTCEDTDVIAGWVRRAGLQVAGVLPVKAAMLRAALFKNAQSSQAGDDVIVQLHLGEHAMTLTAWRGGQLVLARCAEVGYSLVVDAVYRSAKSTQRGDLFTREQAIRMLFALGVPQRDQVLDHTLQLRGDAVLPLIQPAIQRYVVEVRQTLRFGMQESDVGKARVQFLGPGARVPGLGDALGAMLDLNIEQTNAIEHTADAIEDEQVGDLALAARLRDVPGWFVPASVQVAHASRRMTMSVRAGGVAAALVLAALASKATLGERTLAPAMAQLQAQGDEIDEQAALRVQASRKAQDLESALSLTRSVVGTRTNWRAALGMLASSLPSQVVLRDISADYGSAEAPGQPMLTLRGSVKPKGPAAPGSRGAEADEVSNLLASLNKSRLVVSARVVSSSVDASTGGREFVVQVQLRGVQLAGVLEAPHEDDEIPLHEPPSASHAHPRPQPLPGGAP